MALAFLNDPDRDGIHCLVTWKECANRMTYDVPNSFNFTVLTPELVKADVELGR